MAFVRDPGLPERGTSSPQGKGYNVGDLLPPEHGLTGGSAPPEDLRRPKGFESLDIEDTEGTHTIGSR